MGGVATGAPFATQKSRERSGIASRIRWQTWKRGLQNPLERRGVNLPLGVILRIRARGQRVHLRGCALFEWNYETNYKNCPQIWNFHVEMIIKDNIQNEKITGRKKRKVIKYFKKKSSSGDSPLTTSTLFMFGSFAFSTQKTLKTATSTCFVNNKKR